MADLHDAIAAEAERTAFSGVVRVDRGAETLVAQAFGLADRGREVPNTVGNPIRAREWREGLHGARGDVALSRTARLALDTTARSVLGDDLPLIDDEVTVEHKLVHRSGIKDCLDEDAIKEARTTYVMPVPVHWVCADRGLPAGARRAPAGVRSGRALCAYDDSGFVRARTDRRARQRHPVRASSCVERVCEPAGMRNTSSSLGLRTSRWALRRLDIWTTNGVGRTRSTCPC